MAPEDLPAGRPTRVEIDLDSFARNISTVQDRLPPGSRLIAVVKADAYGHGSVPLARVAERIGVPMLLVVLVEEAIELRKAGIELPILTNAVLSQAEIDLAIANRISMGVTSVEMLRDVAGRSVDSPDPVHVHVKFDTGMGRLGILPREIDEVVALLDSAPDLVVDGYYSHFARSFLAEDPMSDEQTRRLESIVTTLKERGHGAPAHHISSSAGLARGIVTPGAWVRVGLLLYGGEPVNEGRHRLAPVMRWITHVVSIKDLPAGHTVGYGTAFTTTRPSRIAALPVGYADGYDWRLGNNADVLIRGRRVPVVGSISMDCVTVDVTDFADVALRDEVVLLGRQGDEEISAEELASRIGTIPYEVFCRIGKRVPRYYHGGTTTQDSHP